MHVSDNCCNSVKVNCFFTLTFYKLMDLVLGRLKETLSWFHKTACLLVPAHELQGKTLEEVYYHVGSVVKLAFEYNSNYQSLRRKLESVNQQRAKLTDEIFAVSSKLRDTEELLVKSEGRTNVLQERLRQSEEHLATVSAEISVCESTPVNSLHDVWLVKVAGLIVPAYELQGKTASEIYTHIGQVVSYMLGQDTGYVSMKDKLDAVSSQKASLVDENNTLRGKVLNLNTQLTESLETVTALQGKMTALEARCGGEETPASTSPVVTTGVPDDVSVLKECYTIMFDKLTALGISEPTAPPRTAVVISKEIDKREEEKRTLTNRQSDIKSELRKLKSSISKAKKQSKPRSFVELKNQVLMFAFPPRADPKPTAEVLQDVKARLATEENIATFELKTGYTLGMDHPFIKEFTGNLKLSEVREDLEANGLWQDSTAVFEVVDHVKVIQEQVSKLETEDEQATKRIIQLDKEIEKLKKELKITTEYQQYVLKRNDAVKEWLVKAGRPARKFIFSKLRIKVDLSGVGPVTFWSIYENVHVESKLRKDFVDANWKKYGKSSEDGNRREADAVFTTILKEAVDAYLSQDNRSIANVISDGTTQGPSGLTVEECYKVYRMGDPDSWTSRITRDDGKKRDASDFAATVKFLPPFKYWESGVSEDVRTFVEKRTNFVYIMACTFAEKSYRQEFKKEVDDAFRSFSIEPIVVAASYNAFRTGKVIGMNSRSILELIMPETTPDFFEGLVASYNAYGLTQTPFYAGDHSSIPPLVLPPVPEWVR